MDATFMSLEAAAGENELASEVPPASPDAKPSVPGKVRGAARRTSATGSSAVPWSRTRLGAGLRAGGLQGGGGVDRDPLQQSPEGLLLLVVKTGQRLVLGRAQPLAEPVEEGPAAGSGRDPPGPPVGRVRAPLDQAGLGQAVEQVGHDRAVHAQMLGQRELAAGFFPGGRREHLVAARTAGHVGEGRRYGLHVGPGQRAEGPAEVVLENAGVRPRAARPETGRPGSRSAHEAQDTPDQLFDRRVARQMFCIADYITAVPEEAADRLAFRESLLWPRVPPPGPSWSSVAATRASRSPGR